MEVPLSIVAFDRTSAIASVVSVDDPDSENIVPARIDGDDDPAMAKFLWFVTGATMELPWMAKARYEVCGVKELPDDRLTIDPARNDGEEPELIEKLPVSLAIAA